VQFPIPQITTIMLLVHMVLGCCTHHVHACETHCCAAPTASAEACPCSTHQHDSDVPASPVNGLVKVAESGSHGGQHHCQGNTCTFVRVQPSPEHIGEFAADICPLELIVAECDADSHRPYLERGFDPLLSPARPRLRAHLVLHVLLI
jgi:hypothetical protein